MAQWTTDGKGMVAFAKYYSAHMNVTNRERSILESSLSKHIQYKPSIQDCERIITAAKNISQYLPKKKALSTDCLTFE